MLRFFKKKYDEEGYDKKGYNKDGYNRDGYNKEGYNKNGFSSDGYNHYGYNQQGFDRSGYDKNGYDKDGISKEGFSNDGRYLKYINEDKISNYYFISLYNEFLITQKESFFKFFYPLHNLAIESKNVIEFDEVSYKIILDLIDEANFLNPIPEEKLKRVIQENEVLIIKGFNAEGIPQLKDELLSIISVAKAMCKIIYILKKIENLCNNKEFFNIQKNLYKEFNLDETIEKLYPIYEKFYLDTFEEKIDKMSLKILVGALNNYENPQLKRLSINFKEKFMSSNLYHKKLEFYEVIEEITRHLDENLMEVINQTVEEKHNKKLIEETSNYTYVEAYKYILDEVFDVIPFETYIELAFYYYEIKKNGNALGEKIYLHNEKERFLQGDFSLESSIEEAKFDLNNVGSGYEFEEFLGKLFENLGYKVEVTKSSGDQGADLIIEKNYIKTVVQAKYYSSSVGNKSVQEVLGAMNYYSADRGMVVTNSYFTSSAKDLSVASNVRLIDGEELNLIIKNMYISDDIIGGRDDSAEYNSFKVDLEKIFEHAEEKDMEIDFVDAYVFWCDNIDEVYKEYNLEFLYSYIEEVYPNSNERNKVINELEDYLAGSVSEIY